MSKPDFMKPSNDAPTLYQTLEMAEVITTRYAELCNAVTELREPIQKLEAAIRKALLEETIRKHEEASK